MLHVLQLGVTSPREPFLQTSTANRLYFARILRFDSSRMTEEHKYPDLFEPVRLAAAGSIYISFFVFLKNCAFLRNSRLWQSTYYAYIHAQGYWRINPHVCEFSFLRIFRTEEFSVMTINILRVHAQGYWYINLIYMFFLLYDTQRKKVQRAGHKQLFRFLIESTISPCV